MELYNASLPYDKKMYAVDLEGTRVYTSALAKIGLLSKAELAEIHRVSRILERNGLMVLLLRSLAMKISTLLMSAVLVKL